MNVQNNSKGFTLVELAIVMTIIGLLIGGVIKGQELVWDAKVKSTMKAIEAYKTANLAFRDLHSYRPGDLPSATRKIANCVNPLCLDGNGDGLIGTRVYIWERGVQERNSENQQFWEHLALSDMIVGVQPTSNQLEFGYSHPNAPLGGGFSVVSSRASGSVASPDGVWLRVHGYINDTNPELTPVLSPSKSARIDRKFDDGKPGTGDIRAFQDGNPAPNTPDNCEHAYDETSSMLRCLLTFKLSN